MSVRLTLLGRPSLHDERSERLLDSERRCQLLAYLALKRSWIGRPELAALLWPEQEPKLAYTNLRKALHRLQALPGAALLQSQGSALRFECATDVHDFEAALRDGRIDDALALWKGDLLCGFDDDGNEAWSTWLRFERDRLRAAWRIAAQARLAAGADSRESIELAARLLEADPLDEDALRLYLAALGAAGQTARMRQAYREYAERMQRELGLSPGAAVAALVEAQGSGTPAVPRGPAAAAASGDDGFVGRVVERRRIVSLLGQDDCRLLSLIGPGGVGKTRLAQRIVQDGGAGFEDAAIFVPLDDLGTAGEIGPRLVRVLGLTSKAQIEPFEQAIEALRASQRLLVLDNFEHLMDAVPLVAHLLAQCPRVKVLVTSRVRLALAGEWLLPVEGLPWPDAEDLAQVEAFDATRLFFNAARRVRPDFSLGAEASAVADICRQVEGLPLALELAASWTRLLSCEAIAAELLKGTELLSTPDAGRPARHAGVDVVFEQSWRLLAPVERDALARLATFRGGFTAEAAREVTGAPLALLAALSDKSLLRREGTRMYLHPLVQQLAVKRFDDPAELASAEEAHARYFHTVLIQLRRPVDHGGREALQRLGTELENCRSAWRWSICHAVSESLVRCAPTFTHYFDHEGRFMEGLALLQEPLQSETLRGEEAARARLQSYAAFLAYRLDRYTDAESAAAEALAVAERLHDRETELQCLRVLGSCCLRRGQLDDARRHFGRSLREGSVRSDPQNAADMLNNLSVLENMGGRYDEAMRLGREALALYRGLGDVPGEVSSTINVAHLYVLKGEYDAANVQLKAALVLCERQGLAHFGGVTLGMLTELARKAGDHDAGQRYATQGLEFAEAVGYRALSANLKLEVVHFALGRSDLAAARTALADALRIAIDIGRPKLQLSGLACFAEILAAQGDFESAGVVLRHAIAHPLASAPEREEYNARLAQWLGSPAPQPARSGIPFDELVQRIVAEAPVAHAPLISALHRP